MDAATGADNANDAALEAGIDGSSGARARTGLDPLPGLQLRLCTANRSGRKVRLQLSHATRAVDWKVWNCLSLKASTCVAVRGTEPPVSADPIERLVYSSGEMGLGPRTSPALFSH
jgi:hypothetical protein